MELIHSFSLISFFLSFLLYFLFLPLSCWLHYTLLAGPVSLFPFPAEGSGMKVLGEMGIGRWLFFFSFYFFSFFYFYFIL